jgi:hypothetical protein
VHDVLCTAPMARRVGAWRCRFRFSGEQCVPSPRSDSSFASVVVLFVVTTTQRGLGIWHPMAEREQEEDANGGQSSLAEQSANRTLFFFSKDRESYSFQSATRQSHVRSSTGGALAPWYKNCAASSNLF